MIKAEKKITNGKIIEGLNHLLSRDRYLLSANISERAITHKLAEYYQQIFPEWNVDCEYNKNLGREKVIEIDVRKFLCQMAVILEKNKKYFFGTRKDIDSIDIDNVELLLQQLKDPRLEYSEELDVIFHVIKLRDNKELRKSVIPDIIVHHRGTKDNYIVIEAKRSEKKRANDISRTYDRIKLISLVDSKDYHYKTGYFIDIPTSEKFLEKHSSFKIEENKFDNRVSKIYSI